MKGLSELNRRGKSAWPTSLSDMLVIWSCLVFFSLLGSKKGCSKAGMSIQEAAVGVQGQVIRMSTICR